MANIAPVVFESSWKKKEEKQQLKEAREELLEKTKAEFERKEWKKEQARLRGEGTWMLTAVSDRIDDENKDIEKSKKKKKHKKEKKHKKKTKKDDSDDNSDEDNNTQWVEKTSSQSVGIIKGPKLQRDDWMMAPADLFGGVTREQLRAERNKAKEEEKLKASILDQPGTHERELNPYWKDGGKGLPEEEIKKSSKSVPVIGDGGASWLRKAYQRCKEQAEEEGRSLEELAAERYGSLKKLEDMIAEAENSQSSKGRKPAFRRPRSRSQERSSGSRDRRSRSRDRERRKRSHSREKGSRSHSRERRKSRSRSRDRVRKNISPSGRKSRSQSRERGRSRSRSRDKNISRSRSRDRNRSRSRERNRSRSRERHRRERSRERSNQSSIKKSRGLFKKPGELTGRETSSSSTSGAWRKKDSQMLSYDKQKTFSKPNDNSKSERSLSREKLATSSSSTLPASKKSGKVKSSSESDSSSSSNGDSDSGSEHNYKDTSKHNATPEPVILLSEDEMNKLAAKVMRAEIIGNDALAKELQSKLNAARLARQSAPAEVLAAGHSQPSGRNDTPEDVLLTRTDRSGMTRPIFESKHPKEPTKGRRKKQKVATHDDSGTRSRYFDDDDKFTLKDLVIREKMSTAEDQNSMFSRLAGKSFDKTDEDYDMDDVFMTRAAKKQSDSKLEENDKSIAIFEHRKISAAMEKCNRCIEKTQKHLIIALGIKVFLCLPPHKSLSPGHCLIVPMQHISSATNVDEDVWTEIQVFRKGLTRMFQDKDEDVVFMETSMHLGKHPHMAIEVIPMPNEVGNMAPIYFKKAIQETGEEWAQNKKLVDLSGKDVRKAIPKGFPYFSVDFGLQSGFAHVIEDEKTFPQWFGREIVGGMLEADPTLWRKPHRENFDDQRKKVLEFASWWKPYDWTQRLKKQDDDSD